MNLYQGEDIRVDIRNMLFIRGQFAWNRLPRAVGTAPRAGFQRVLDTGSWRPCT